MLSHYVRDSQASLGIACQSFASLMTSVTSRPDTPNIPLLVLDDSWAISLPMARVQKSISSDSSSVRVETEPPASTDPRLDNLLTSCAMPNEFYQTAQAMILYTSGTTGKPKGVLLSHVNVDAQVRTLVRAWAWSPADIIVHVLPLHHTHGIVNALLCPLYVGARCIMVPKFDAGAVWSKLLGVGMAAKDRPTIFMAVPTVYAKLLDEYDTKFAGNAKLREHVRALCSSKIRLMVSGSAQLPEPVFQRWHAATGHYLLERYGMTEIGMALSNPLKGKRRPGHVGMPLPDVRVRIADFKSDGGSKGRYETIAEGNFKATRVEPGKAGMNGELLVKGPTVFQGYWNNPEATDKEFTHDGWFRTGDIAEFNKGYYKILGRSSTDIIKSGGYKISALQVETELLAHPSVRDCAVVGVDDDKWGQVVTAVVELTTSKDGPPTLALSADAVLEAELRGWCKERMPPYAAPTRWLIVGRLPRNVMGKVNKKELIRQLFPPPSPAAESRIELGK